MPLKTLIFTFYLVIVVLWGSSLLMTIARDLEDNGELNYEIYNFDSYMRFRRQKWYTVYIDWGMLIFFALTFSYLVVYLTIKFLDYINL